MENQERHPVDELFGRRLREVEKSPSPRAWNTLERQLSRKKNSSNGKLGGWLAIAASVAVLAGCFVAVRYWQPDEPQTVATQNKASKQTVATEEPRQSQQKAEAQTQDQADQPMVVGTEKSEPVFVTPATDNSVTKQPEQLAKNLPKRTVKPTVSQETQKTEQTPAPKQTAPLATDNQEVIAAVEPTTKPTPKPTSEVTVVVVELPDETQNDTETTVATEPEQPTKKKAARLWQAIKKAKQSQINVDKDALFAWVKERSPKPEK